MEPVTWIILTALFLVIIADLCFGYKITGYSRLTHTISELGHSGIQFRNRVNFGIFLPVGLLFYLAGILIYLKTGEFTFFLMMAFSMGTGYVIAAFFPADPGSPLRGSTNQQIHNLGGAVQYVGGIVALFGLTMEEVVRGIVFEAAGWLTLIFAAGIVFPVFRRWRGLCQRIVELILFGCLLMN